MGARLCLEALSHKSQLTGVFCLVGLGGGTKDPQLVQWNISDGDQIADGSGIKVLKPGDLALISHSLPLMAANLLLYSHINGNAHTAGVIKLDRNAPHRGQVAHGHIQGLNWVEWNLQPAADQGLLQEAPRHFGQPTDGHFKDAVLALTRDGHFKIDLRKKTREQDHRCADRVRSAEEFVQFCRAEALTQKNKHQWGVILTLNQDWSLIIINHCVSQRLSWRQNVKTSEPWRSMCLNLGSPLFKVRFLGFLIFCEVLQRSQPSAIAPQSPSQEQNRWVDLLYFLYSLEGMCDYYIM